MQGVSRSGKSFGDVTGFRIGGQATMGDNHFVTEEKMAEDKLNCYFFRRGASVHWGYTMPEANVEYFYNEVLVTEENVRNSSYYMMNGSPKAIWVFNKRVPVSTLFCSLSGALILLTILVTYQRTKE